MIYSKKFINSIKKIYSAFETKMVEKEFLWMPILIAIVQLILSFFFNLSKGKKLINYNLLYNDFISLFLPIIFVFILGWLLRRHYLRRSKGINIPIILIGSEEHKKSVNVNILNEVKYSNEFKELKRDISIEEVKIENLIIESNKKIKDLNEKIKKIKYFLEEREIIDKAQFSIFLESPRIIETLFLGASFYGYENIKILRQKNNDKNYHLDIHINGRNIKTIIEEKNFKHICIERLDSNYNDIKYLNIIIDLVSHPVTPEAMNFINKNIYNSFTCVIKCFYQGNIPEDYFTDITKEINSAIFILQKEANINEINVLGAMPVSIAFAIGTYLGKNKNINLYDYDISLSSYYKYSNLKDDVEYISGI